VKTPDRYDRYEALLAKARTGDENATHDLFAEFGVPLTPAGDAQLPPTEETETKTPSVET
jgi:hypothetical protein